MSDVVLAAAQELNFKPAGWVGLLVIIGLCVGFFFLMRSMTRQMKKVDFDEEATERPRRTPPSDDPPRDAA